MSSKWSYRKLLNCRRCYCSQTHLDADTYASVLRQCGNARDLEQGKRVHARLLESSYSSVRFLSNLVIEMYGKCGSLKNARAAFESMCDKNVFSWTMMITALTQNGHPWEALTIFRHMQLEGVRPDKITFIWILATCSDAEALAEGREISKLISCDSILNTDIILGTALLNFYGKFAGCIEEARRVFNTMIFRDVVCCTAMLQAYIRHNLFEDVIYGFRQFELEGMKLNETTLCTVLTACSGLKDIAQGSSIHSRIRASGCMSTEVGNSILTMYGKCGRLKEASLLFDIMKSVDIVSWNIMISAYTQNGQLQESMMVYHRMDLEGVKPNDITFISVLDACRRILEGKSIHQRVELTCTETTDDLNSALVDMYGKCGGVDEARQLLLQSGYLRNVVSCTSMISACVKHGHFCDARMLFRRLDHEGIPPNKVTFVNILGACSSVQEVKALHVRLAFYDKDVVVSNALINMYGRCGSIDDAKEVFERNLTKNIVSWNAIISVSVLCANPEDALQLFKRMDLEGVTPNIVTLAVVLDACVKSSALALGKQIHAELITEGTFVAEEPVIESSLVNMYAKCGSCEEAWKSLNIACSKSIVLWTSMITAYAQHGCVQEVFSLCRRMDLEGIQPNSVTFLTVLFACSHAGLVEHGCCYFKAITQDYGMEVANEHYSCIINLLGRMGWLQEAEHLAMELKCRPSDASLKWITLLGACRMHADPMGSLRAIEHIRQVSYLNG